MFSESTAKRFESKIDKCSHDECWEWTGAKNHDGYGVFSDDKGILKRAHRLSYELFFGKPPIDKPLILHKCNNRGCVNPYHLYAGTASDNMKDRLNSGYIHKDNIPKTADKMFKYLITNHKRTKK